MKWIRIVAVCLLMFVLGINTATAQQLSGALSGVLGPGTYYVVGSIYVMYGSTLTIQPGTTILFNGDYDFDIYGTFYAIGTETDSIKFLRNGTSSPWNGIDFNSTINDSSLLEYVYVSGSDGGGLYFMGCHPTVSHCLIANNSAGTG
jgi:hypothetical protein